jgi:tetratricopeptide (TPR) repeat protein
MNDTLSIEIRKYYYLLSEEERKLLRVCTILCKEGVTLRHLCDIFGEDSHIFGKQMQSLLRVGLLQDLTSLVYSPDEVSVVLHDIPIPTDTLDAIMSRLIVKTTLSIKDDLLQFREFFQMGYGVIDYILELKETDGIDYSLYAKLVINLARHHAVFGHIDPSIYTIDDLRIMRCLRMAREHTDRGSLTYAALNTSIARIYLSGFHYEQAKPLLDEAIEIERQYGESEMAETNFVYSLYWENYSHSDLCLYHAYLAFTRGDEPIKYYAAILIAFQLALHGEKVFSDAWLAKIDIDSIPQLNEVRVMVDLIYALKQDTSQAETLLNKAELSLMSVNPDAAMLSRVYYVRSQILNEWGLFIQSNDLYRKYVHLIHRHYAATDGGLAILQAAECVRLTNMGAMTAARNIVNNVLESVNLLHPNYALSVKQDVCFAFTIYYSADGAPSLAETYCTMGMDFAKQALPSEETLNILRNIFGEDMPDYVTGNDVLWQFEHLRLLALLENKKLRKSDIRFEIEHILNRFTKKKSELEVILASLLDRVDAVYAWHKLIITSAEEDKYAVALHCAHAAIQRGFLWEGAIFFDLVQQTDEFHNLNQYKKVNLLLEIVINLEECGGYWTKAIEYWKHLEHLAENTPLLADVFQARANIAVDRAQYQDAIKYYGNCLGIIPCEEGLIDERLSSIHANMSTCFGALKDYQNAYDSSQKALHYFPANVFESFNLVYNITFFSVALGKHEEALNMLAKATKLARTDEDEECLKELSAILALKPAQRKAYFM